MDRQSLWLFLASIRHNPTDAYEGCLCAFAFGHISPKTFTVCMYIPMYIPCFPLAASNKLSHNQLEAGLKLFSHVEQWHGRVRITYLLTVASSLQATCTEGKCGVLLTSLCLHLLPLFVIQQHHRVCGQHFLYDENDRTSC